MDKDPFHLTVESHHGRTVRWKGETYLYYSGTNYLGIAALKSVQALVVEGMALYGCHVSASRSANIALPVFDSADQCVAEWLGVARAVLLSSGFTACQILLKSLEEEGHELIYTPGVHPANWRHLQDKETVPWEQLLHKIKHAQHPIAVLCKSVDPIYLKKVRFDWLQEVPRDKRVVLVIDDSHTLGIQGAKGEGIYGEIKEQVGERALILVGSLGKGLGMPAGVIGGSKHWIERVRESPYYAGASMPNPAFVHALMAIIPMLPSLQRKLQRNIARFEDAPDGERMERAFRLHRTLPHLSLQEHGGL